MNNKNIAIQEILIYTNNDEIKEVNYD